MWVKGANKGASKGASNVELVYRLHHVSSNGYERKFLRSGASVWASS